jgi:hypothetical protein
MILNPTGGGSWLSTQLVGQYAASNFRPGTTAWTSDKGQLISDGSTWDVLSGCASVVYVSSISSVAGDGVTDDSAAINAACLALYNAGGGTLVFDAKTYYVPSGIKAYVGVMLQGQGYVTSQSSLNASFAYVSGTRFLGNNTNPGYFGNCNSWFQRLSQRTAQPTIDQVIQQGLMGIGCSGILFDTVTYGIKIGSLYNTGAFYNSEFSNLCCINYSVWGLYFENCTSTMYKSLNAYTAVSGAVGSVYFGSSQTQYNAGVLDINKVETYPNNAGTGTNVRGIVVQARAGAQLNAVELNSAANSNAGNVKVSQVATMSNGSATITVTDGTKFPRDMPVTVSATANGFTVNQTYFVIKNGTTDGLSANQVQLSNVQAGASVNATGNSAVNLVTYGYPSFEVCGRAYNSDYPTVQDKLEIPSISLTTSLSASTGANVKGFTGIKLYPESYQTTGILWQAAGADIQMASPLTGGAQGTSCASHICVRTTSVAPSGRFAVTDQNEAFIYDADSAGTGLFCSGAVVATGGIVQKPIVGFYNDSSGIPTFNLTDGHNSTNATFVNILPSDNLRCITYPVVGFGQRQELINYTGVSYTLDSTHIGTMVFTNATPGSWVFPSISGATTGGAAGSWIGAEFEFVNAGGAALTLTSANATQSFNKPSSGKTSYSLAAGGTMKVRICTDGTNAFLAVIANNGAT